MSKYLSYYISIIISGYFFYYLSYDFSSSVAVCIFFFWLIRLIQFSSDYLPMKELILALYGLQYLFGAALTYNGFEDYTPYKMKVPSGEYFLMVIPIFVSFSLGFRVFFNEKLNTIDRNKFDKLLTTKPNLPYFLISIGFISPIISNYIPDSLVFVGYLLESFKFIGLFMLVLGSERLNTFMLIGIYGFVLISSFYGGMFHDLLTWLIILGLILIYRYKPDLKFKLIGILTFVLFAVFIQSIKGGFRETVFENQEQLSLEVIQDVNTQNNVNNGGFFSIENIGPQVTRVNQAWILASVINYVPTYEKHTYGSLTLQYLFSAIMPRVLAPNKMNAGELSNFIKYSDHDVTGATMGLGLFADAYIEFGQYGAIIYVFIFGMFYGFVLYKFLKYSRKYPIVILFSTVAFIYPMRPDCETQTVLGHLFKTIILLFMIFLMNRKIFELPSKNEYE